MTTNAVTLIQDIYQHAVKAVQPKTVIPMHVKVLPDGALKIGDRAYRIAGQPVYSIAFGKAAGQMSVELEATLGDRLAGSIAVVKDPVDDTSLSAQVLVGSHPVPDERSLRAGAEILDFASKLPDEALVVCLISGGGSALMESLRDGVTLEQLRDTTSALLRAGASIHELNAVRARLSTLKAGGLLAALDHSEVVNLIISDVLGDDLSTIASGPTVPRAAAMDAEDVLRKYRVDADLPALDFPSLSSEPYSLVVASLQTALQAASDAAMEHGVTPAILSSSLTGEARVTADVLASIVADSAAGLTSFGPGTCLLAGGETTVTVRGDGKGGRNTESALAAALRLSGVNGATIGFLATDGDDAETGVAGAIVSGETVSVERQVQARKALDDNDSYTFLRDAGAVWGDGPTGTNVNDLVIGVVT